MSARTRKFIGAIGLVVFVVAYALTAMTIGSALLGDAPGWQRFAYYITAGIAWALPVMPLVRWMQRPD